MKKYFKGNDVVINPGGGGSTGSTSNKTEDLQFYYHPDHLGSSNYITDVSGEVYQHLEYFPFGETFIEERNNAEYTTYLFNGKELDEETGLYYYGARYYDARTSLWQSVDPLAEKYPSWSPYNYAVNNPIRFIDINGLEPGDRVKAARSMIGSAYKQETISSMRTASSSEARQYMDCAEFVCRVMSADQITDRVKHMAGSGLKTFLDDKKKFEFSKTPEVGDIAAWEGHVGIVTAVGEDGKIKLTHARGVGKLASENPYAITPEKYRPGSKFYGYYRPVEETPDGKLDGRITTAQSSQTAEDNRVYYGGVLPEVTVIAQGSVRIQPIDVKRIELENK